MMHRGSGGPERVTTGTAYRNSEVAVRRGDAYFRRKVAVNAATVRRARKGEEVEVVGDELPQLLDGYLATFPAEHGVAVGQLHLCNAW